MFIEGGSGDNTTNASFIGVDYDEGDPGTFRSIVVQVRSTANEILRSNNFPTMTEADVYAHQHGCKVFVLSSADNFIADGGEIPN